MSLRNVVIWFWMFSTVSQCFTFSSLHSGKKKSLTVPTQDYKGYRDHQGVASGQEVGRDGHLAGGNVMVELDHVFVVSAHARDLAFQSLEHLQVKG